MGWFVCSVYFLGVGIGKKNRPYNNHLRLFERTSATASFIGSKLYQRSGLEPPARSEWGMFILECVMGCLSTGVYDLNAQSQWSLDTFFGSMKYNFGCFCPPPRMTVTTRIVTCLVAGIPINLHLPLIESPRALGVIYIAPANNDFVSHSMANLWTLRGSIFSREKE